MIKVQILGYASDAELSPVEAARLLKTTKSTLANARMFGRGAKFIRTKRGIRYRVSDIATYLESMPWARTCIQRRAA